MPSKVEIICKCGCGEKRMVRKADVARGWGLYINKSHKARHQSSSATSSQHFKKTSDDKYSQFKGVTSVSKESKKLKEWKMKMKNCVENN